VPGDALVGKSIGRWWAGAWDRSCGLVERVDVIFLIFYEIDQQRADCEDSVAPG